MRLHVSFPDLCNELSESINELSESTTEIDGDTLHGALLPKNAVTKSANI